MSQRDRWFAPLLGSAVLLAAVVQASGDEPVLYRWLDRKGVIRYTPDLSRIPDTRRKTAVKVVKGTTPRGEPLSPAGSAQSQTQPQGNAPEQTAHTGPATVAPLGPSLAGAEPFNAPGEARPVTRESTTTAGNSWPELDARIAELEVLIEADEEIIKEMISAAPSEGSDDLINSPVLRQIAARLPILQGELNELRRWREQPRDQ